MVIRIWNHSIRCPFYSHDEMTKTFSTFVLLDRDGVINVDRSHSVRDRSEFALIDGVPHAIQTINAKGYGVIVITNQACVGRGDLASDELDVIHDIMKREVEAGGGTIKDLYVCPHVDADHCPCRKPKPGLLEKAQNDYGFRMHDTFFVGDDIRDMQAARAAGARPAVVRTGKGDTWTPPEEVPVFDNLTDFARSLPPASTQ